MKETNKHSNHNPGNGTSNGNGGPKPPTSAPGRSGKRLGVQEGYIFIPIYATTNRGRPIWQVPRGKSADGKRLAPRTFHTLAEAQDYARALAKGRLNEQAVFGRISAEGLKASALVARLLEPFCARLGIGLDQAVREYIAAKQLAATRPLKELISDYLSQPWVTKSRIPIGEAVTAFLAAKASKGCRPQTLLNLRHNLNPVAEALHNAPVGEITTGQLNRSVHRPGYAPRGNKTVYCALHNFYGWLKRNNYLRGDIPSAMDAVQCPLVKQGPPAIMDLATAKRALQIAARDTDPE